MTDGPADLQGNTSGSPENCGWLEKRYPCIDGNWEWRWCVLEPTRLTYYTDKACSAKRGSIGIRPATRLVRFQSPHAPDDAAEYHAERPFGFVIDDGSSSEKGRRFYFDAREESTLKLWAEAVEAAARWSGSQENVKHEVLPRSDSMSKELAVLVIRAALAAALHRQKSAPGVATPASSQGRLAHSGGVTGKSPKGSARAPDRESLQPRLRCRTWGELWQELCRDAERPVDDAAAVAAFAQWRTRSNLESRTYWFFSTDLWTRAECSELTLAIRSGVAGAVRGDVWYKCCDAPTKRRLQGVTTANVLGTSYVQLVEAGNNLGDIEAMRIIEADLPRTGLKGVNQDVLRNVLVAFAAANSQIGYCQSMNFIAATLLSYLEEERCFWTLLSLIEDVLPPDYFTSGMTGLRTDLKVLGSLMERHLPRLYEHMENEQLDLSAITMNWFLCLYLNTLPCDVAHRVLDCLMHEGPEVLFRVAMAILQAYEEELLMATSLPDAYVLLRAPCEADSSKSHSKVAKLLTDDLFTRMYGQWLNSWSAEELANLRTLHLPTVQAEDRAAAERRAARAHARSVVASAAATAAASMAAPTADPMEPAASLRRSSEVLKELQDQASLETSFPMDCSVEAHSLSTAELNGLRAKVVGFDGDRVVVKFETKGKKALKPTNLKRLEEDALSPIASSLWASMVATTSWLSTGTSGENLTKMEEIVTAGRNAVSAS